MGFELSPPQEEAFIAHQLALNSQTMDIRMEWMRLSESIDFDLSEE